MSAEASPLSGNANGGKFFSPSNSEYSLNRITASTWTSMSAHTSVAMKVAKNCKALPTAAVCHATSGKFTGLRPRLYFVTFKIANVAREPGLRAGRTSSSTYAESIETRASRLTARPVELELELILRRKPPRNLLLSSHCPRLCTNLSRIASLGTEVCFLLASGSIRRSQEMAITGNFSLSWTVNGGLTQSKRLGYNNWKRNLQSGRHNTSVSYLIISFLMPSRKAGLYQQVTCITRSFRRLLLFHQQERLLFFNTVQFPFSHDWRILFTISLCIPRTRTLRITTIYLSLHFLCTVPATHYLTISRPSEIVYFPRPKPRNCIYCTPIPYSIEC